MWYVEILKTAVKIIGIEPFNDRSDSFYNRLMYITLLSRDEALIVTWKKYHIDDKKKNYLIGLK